MQNYEISPQILISQNTEKLILSRIEDDFRLQLTHQILFGKEIRDDIKKNNSANSEMSLRMAIPGDVFTYSLVPEYERLKFNLEQNLINIATLRAKKQLNDLKRVWVFTYDMAREGDEYGSPDLTIYVEPNAADINKIIKENRIILGVFIVVEYGFPQIADKKQEGTARIEWSLMSPADSKRIDEYNQYLKDREAEALERLFYIKFDSSKLKEEAKSIANKIK